MFGRTLTRYIRCRFCNGNHSNERHVCSKCFIPGHENFCTRCRVRGHCRNAACEAPPVVCGTCHATGHHDSAHACEYCDGTHSSVMHVCTCGHMGHNVGQSACAYCNSLDHCSWMHKCDYSGCGGMGHIVDHHACDFCEGPHQTDQHPCDHPDCSDVGHTAKDHCDVCENYFSSTKDHCKFWRNKCQSLTAELTSMTIAYESMRQLNDQLQMKFDALATIRASNEDF